MEAWEKFVASQEAELGTETVQNWLKTLKVLHFDACNLFLEAKDAFQAMWFEEHIRQKISAKLFNNNRKKIKVHLTVANAPSKKLGAKAKDKDQAVAASTPPAQLFKLSFDELDPCSTFDHYVVSDSNLLTYKLLSGISKDSPHEGLQTFNPIFIHGGPGTGKTHLLMATAQALRSKNLHVIYSCTQTFTDHVVSAIRAGEMSVFRQAYRNTDVLILDDVHVFSRKGATQEEFFHTFNTLHMAGKQLIFSANCAPGELQLIEPRLVSRFEWGIVLSLESPKKEELSQILQQRLNALNFSLNTKVTDFLLSTFSNSKTLCRALEALILRSHLNEVSEHLSQTHLTVPLVKQILTDLILEEERLALTPNRIIHCVAEFFGIRAEDILGKAQTRECVLPRQISMHLCRQQLKMPYTKIADLFKKDHSTVMSSVKLIQKGIDENDQEIIGLHHTIFKRLVN